MANTLQGFTALFRSIATQVFQWPTVLVAKKSDDTLVLLNADSNGNLITSQAGAASGGVTLVSSTAYESNRVLKASAGTLINITGFNSGPQQFIQLHNTTTLPADAAVPKVTLIAYAGSNFSYDVPITGTPFTTGIVVCNSTTGPTKTIGAADCFFSATIL